MTVTDVDFVVVSGPPGSGKSTIAAPLAERLRLPLLEKDTIKEALMDALGVATVEDSRRLGRASIATLFALAYTNGRGVLETNWSARGATRDLQSLDGVMVEVFCDVDPTVSHQRYVDRSGERHRGHFDRDRGDDWGLWQRETLEPVGGGWPVVRVDTGSPVDMDALVRSISAATES